MKNQIIIHATANQSRVALIEHGELAQLFIESPENQRTVGNIYLAEVHKVMAGIRAAFISLGTQKDAFLHFSDTGEHLENYLVMLNGRENVPVKKTSESKEGATVSVTEEQNRAGALLAPKQKVLVQIVKEPIGSKGPRVSTNITVAGRFLVLIPMGEYVAVSKRIRSHKERRRLRSCISSILPDGFGVIVRTLAEGQNEETIHEDLKDVLNKWEAIMEKLRDAKPPALLHQDMDMTESLVRDLFAKDYSRILIDDSRIYRSIKSYVARVAPSMVPNIQLYKGSEHIFDYMKISRDVDSVFSPRVKMPSGGYLIFEQTEAMYVVDVNSGRYAAKRDQEDNSLKTNLESAREIAKQLRLRDIGGIIVVDFIDLREETNRKKVYDELKKEFRKDRAKTNVLPMSDFGLVQITRQRIRPSVVKSVSKVCPMCGGSGSIISQNTIVADIEGWLTKFKYNYKGYLTIDLHLNTYLRSMLLKGFISQRLKWMLSYRLFINLVAEESMSMNDFKVMLPNSEIDITDTVLNDQSIEKAISETDLAVEQDARKKKDDPGLDYFHKERKKAENGSTGRSRKTSSSRSADSTKDDASTRSEEQSKQESSSRRGRPPRGDRSRGRRSVDKAKYYKSPKESDEAQQPDSSEPKGERTSEASKSGSPAANTQTAISETARSAQPDSQAPSSTEQLPSALEVARQHKREMQALRSKEDDQPTRSPSPDAPDSTQQKTDKPTSETNN